MSHPVLTETPLTPLASSKALERPCKYKKKVLDLLSSAS